MTDRELLELAAKAAGLLTKTDRYGVWIVEPDGSPVRIWCPHLDDGDAFRLAVKLGLFADTSLTFQFMEAKDCEEVRRIIVHAAAEKAML